MVKQLKRLIDLPTRLAIDAVSKARSILSSPAWLSYPRKVQCNICKWEGRDFLSDLWHEHINCPRCRSGIRQRLFFAALQNIEKFSYEKIIHEKKVLHFAPEEMVGSKIRDRASLYVTADFLRADCDLQLDMSHMPDIKDETFDVVIAFDVLEHVPNYQSALEEIHRILYSKGYAIFTVPQKDNLSNTFEDPNMISPDDRKVHFGQGDHLRIFGDDFAMAVERKGFTVVSVNESMFPDVLVRKHVLFPPLLSNIPLATNFRKVFFCQKMS
jgi:SAM-dependent methyltransferase